MRTTLTIDNDVLYAAKEMARAQNRTAGAVISEIFRKGMASSAPPAPESSQLDRALADIGIHRLPHRGGIVTNEDVNRLREELGI